MMSDASYTPADLLKFTLGLGALYATTVWSPGLGFMASGLLFFCMPVLILRLFWVKASKSPSGEAWRELGMFMVMLALALSGTFAGSTRMDAGVRVAVVPVIQALEAFHARTGHYPEEIEELVPKELAALPVDFTSSMLSNRVSYRHLRATEGTPMDAYTFMYCPLPGTTMRTSYYSGSRTWNTID